MDIKRLSCYKIGIPEIDIDHEEIARLIELLYNSINDNELVIFKILDTLTKTIITHFRNEEIHMDKNNYPFLNHHAIEHAYCLGKIFLLSVSVKKHNDKYKLLYINEIFNELLSHIDNYDLKYAYYLQNKG